MEKNKIKIKNKIKSFLLKTKNKIKEIKLNYVFISLKESLKNILKKTKNFLKISLLVCLLLTVGLGFGLLFSLNNSSILNNLINKALELDNSANSYKEINSYSYQNFSQKYLNETKTKKKEIIQAFQEGKIEYLYSYSSIFYYTYTTKSICSTINLTHNQIISCNSETYQINKFNNQVWVFQHTITVVEG